MLCHPKIVRDVKSILLKFLSDQTISLRIINKNRGPLPVKYLVESKGQVNIYWGTIYLTVDRTLILENLVLLHC